MSAGFAGLAGLQRPQHNGVYVQLRARARACVFCCTVGRLSLPLSAKTEIALWRALRSYTCLKPKLLELFERFGVDRAKHQSQPSVCPVLQLAAALASRIVHRARGISSVAFCPLFFRWHVARCFVSVACCPLSVARCPLHGVLQPSAALLTPAALSRTAAAQSAASRCRTLHGTGPLVVGPLQRQQSTIYS